MEAKPTARGPYKKHKTGYKISVSYELYSSKKQNGSFANPLYVRVRAKKQQSYFKSQIPFLFASTDVEKISQDPLLGSLIEQEIELIKGHLENHIEAFGEYFLISDWLIDFKEFLSERTFPDIVENYVNRAYHVNLISQKHIDHTAFKLLIPNKSNLTESLALAKILKGVGVEGLDQIISCISALSRFSSFFLAHVDKWINPELKALHDSGRALLADFLFFNQHLDNKIRECSISNEEQIVSDLQILKNLQSSEK